MISWLLVAAAFADIIDMEALQACEPCPAGQDERSCSIKRGECRALEAAGWTKQCSYGNGQRFCGDEDAPRAGDAPWPGKAISREPEFENPPLGEAPTPAVHPSEDVPEAVQELAPEVTEAAGCGCSSARWSPGVGLLLLMAAGLRRRREIAS